MKLMAKDPADRYQSAAEMLRDLAKIREALQASADTGGGRRRRRVDDRRARSTTAPVIAPAEGRRRPDRPRPARGRPVPRRLAGPGGGPASLGRAWSLGAAAGWLARPADLLGRAGARPAPPRALWIAPDWREVERKATARRAVSLRPGPGRRRRPRGRLAGRPGLLPQAARLGVAGLHPARPRALPRPRPRPAQGLRRRPGHDRTTAATRCSTQVMIAGGRRARRRRRGGDRRLRPASFIAVKICPTRRLAELRPGDRPPGSRTTHAGSA